MTGEELKLYIKKSGVSYSEIARQLGTTPQNLANKFTKKSVKTDLWEKIYNIINTCCPPLTDEQEGLITGQQAIASGTQSVAAINSTIDGTAALQKENETLRKQNDFLQRQVERLITLLEAR